MYLLPSDLLLQNTKLLILNYVVSDVYKHVQNPSNGTYNFLQNDITPIIQQLPTDSYILVNDVNSYNMGRNEIECWANQIINIVKIVEFGYFENSNHPNIAKFNSSIAKRRTDKGSVFSNFSTTVCQSAYVLLKKI
jgi:hypothetical protein